MSSPNPSSRPYPKHPSPVSHRSNASVPSRTSFRNHTPVSAPNSRPPSQPPSGASSPIDRVAPIHLPSPLPPSGPPSRPASPRHNYSTPSNPDLAFPFMYPYPVNPPIQSLSIFTPQMPGQHRGIPQPPQEHEYRTNRQPQRRLDSVPVAPHPQTESIVYPQPSVFQDVIPNASHFLNGVPHDHSGVSSPFIQEPASGQFVGPFFALPTAQVPQNQFQTGRQGRPKQERSSPNIAHVPPRKGTHSVTIERHADILLDFINTKVEFGIKNSQLIKQAESTLLASLRDHVDGGKGSTKQSCEKAVGTDEDQVIETAAEELLTHTVKEESKPIHRTFVAQAGAWAEERRLLIKRQQELEEEKRVAEERRVADAEQVSKERKEYTSKVEYLSSKVKELQENLAAMHHAEISRKPSGSG
ncbi:hypothetical protein M413DRAFT_443334 [Hebeloma cylindrosporum]|uniref:Uncharacterized protein n=1 Tax=Hebeloma cylindrosporum TaxID=76867 RepID=A0A0C2YTJ1_HEBCY|nr:hypothetical protein M413DRAFT_443334 [Hebeloma cylindrosporum h7]